MSAQYSNQPVLMKEKEKKLQPGADHRRRTRIANVGRGSQRAIKFADTPEKLKRQYAVTELYPRLLYTFSDVIVFVLRNSK